MGEGGEGVNDVSGSNILGGTLMAEASCVVHYPDDTTPPDLVVAGYA